MINDNEKNRTEDLVQRKQAMNTLSDEELFAVSDSLIEQNREAYKELAT